MLVIILISSLIVSGVSAAHQQSNSPPPNLIALIGLSGPLTPAISHSAATRPGRVAVRNQWWGQYGDSTDYGHEVAMNQIGWEAFWRRVNQAPPGTLNTAADMAVMVHLGERPTGGYRIQVTRTYIENHRFVIECAEVAPAPDRYVTQAFSQPWVIAVVPSTKLPIIFKTQLTSTGEIKQ
jgi:hypothetical protein